MVFIHLGWESTDHSKMKLFFLVSSVIVLNYALLSSCAVNYRLPTTIWPSKYVLEITPFFEDARGSPALSFEGSVIITMSTKFDSIRKIVLHSSGLEISPNISIRSLEKPDEPIKIISQKDCILTEKTTFKLNAELVPGNNYNLVLHFHGKMSDQPTGLFHNSYTEGNETKWLAVTQFQATFARKAFPCFDEPQFKAKFVLTVNRPAKFQPTVSNTKISETEEILEQNRVRETFKETPIMSTYLLAYLISEFDHREDEYGKFQIYALPERINETYYGLEVAQKGLKIMNEIFDYDYFSATQKLSLIPVSKHSAGAMENWGMITFKDDNFLIKNIDDVKLRIGITEVILHEEVHQWFGNLVTCKWWSYTWLNEGLTQYLSVDLIHQIEDQFDIDDYYSTKCQGVLLTDSYSRGSAMTKEVNSPAEIRVHFLDSYSRPSCILRMLHTIMQSRFFEALQSYLKEK